MAEQLVITDGTITANLLTAKTSWQLTAGGWLQSDPDEREIRRESYFADGQSIVLSKTQNIIETFEVSLTGASHDAVATTLQTLLTLKREAKEFQTTHWQKTPVYLIDQTSAETNARYALVYKIRIHLGGGLHSNFFASNKSIPRVTILVERESFWRGAIPGSLPTALTLGAPQAPGTQYNALEQFIANYRDTTALTHIYNYDDSMLTSLISHWKLDEASGDAVDSHGSNTLTDTNTVTSGAGLISTGTSRQYTLANSEYHTIADNAALSTGDIDFTWVVWVRLDTKATTQGFASKWAGGGQAEYQLCYEQALDRFVLYVSNDGTAVVGVAADTLGSPSTGTTYFIVASHDSVNNLLKISVNGGAVDTTAHATGVFNSTTAFLIGAVSTLSGFLDGRLDSLSFYKKVLSAAEIATLYNSGSGRDYNFGFSSNLIASSAFTYFVVNGSTPALDDAVYFGSTTNAFHALVMLIGIGGSYSATITWEIWTGAAWTSGRVKQDNAFPGAANSAKLVVVDDPTGWAATTVNGVSAFWVRARISAFTSWTTSPTQAGQVVYNPRDAYISVASTQIDGDVDALGLLRFLKHATTTLGVVFLAAGLKSRGLTNFTSRLNAGGANPGAWSESYGADTTEVADPFSPGGSRASCTFATDIASVPRVAWQNGTRAQASDFEGSYCFYLRCQQIGGSAGDVTVKLTVEGPTSITLPSVQLRAVAGGIELVNLGRVSIYSPGIHSGETATQTITLTLNASAVSSTPDLYIYDLILMPVDELGFVCAGDLTNGPSINGVGNFSEMDAGIIRRGFSKHIEGESQNAVEAYMQTRGSPPCLPPDKAFQIHFLAAGASGGVLYAPSYLAGSLKAYVHEQWEFMRGSE